MFLSLVSVPLKVTVSPASRLRIVNIVRRIVSTEARGRPILPTDRKPGAMLNRILPGANSSRVWLNDANTLGWRVTGFDVAGYRFSVEVRSAAKARVRYTSLPLC